MASTNAADEDQATQQIRELLRANNVRHLHRIGTGTHSRVYQALMARNPVAVKMIDLRMGGEYIERFMERELRIITTLDHQNIIHVHQILRTPEFVAIVEELAPQGDLLNYIRAKEDRRLDEAEAKKIFRQLMEALIYLKENYILHRDIKCENVFLDAQHNVKLGDFGFARQLRPLERSNSHCGSKPYAALELLRGQTYEGNTVDIWSAGVLLFVMLTGRFPFGGANDHVEAIIRRQENQSITFPQQMSRDAINLIKRMLEPDPARRATATQIIAHAWLSTLRTQ